MQDEQIEETKNTNNDKVLKRLNSVRETVHGTTSKNISPALFHQKKYDIQHSRNFKFVKIDKITKFLPETHSEREESWDPTLGIARLHTPKGKLLKQGVPIKKLQKYKGLHGKDNDSITSQDEPPEQPQKTKTGFI